MFHSTVPGSRAARLGAALTVTALAVVGAPALAQAAPDTGSGAGGIGEIAAGSIGELPDQVTVGGPALGSEGLRNVGSGEIADLALSAGQVLGSVAPLEALGSAGGSAVASVASSGLVAGSTYANPSGSLGSGTIGLGSVLIPEYVIPLVGVQLAGVGFGILGDRQDAGQLTPDEINFWHGVVESVAQGGTAAEEAAAAAGIVLPPVVTGSIDAAQVAAEEDPHAQNERRRVEAELARAAQTGR